MSRIAARVRNMPPEFNALPLDLLRSSNWPTWPLKIERGFRDYPALPTYRLPRNAARDPLSNAGSAVAFIMTEGARLAAIQALMRPVGDPPIATAVKNASYAGMEDNVYRRDFPANQAVPWQGHTERVWSEAEATMALLEATAQPRLPASVVAEWAKSFKRRIR
jgi:hypothetical protein